MRHFLYQSDEDTCGLACLRMLLINIKKQRSYRYLTIDGRPPYSLLSLKNAARKEGVEILWKEANKKSDLLSNRSWPILLIMEGDKTSHMVLAKRSKKGKLLIYDPAKGRRWLKGEDCLDKWSGKFGEAHLIESGESHIVEKSNPFPLKDYLIPCSLSLLSVIFIALAFYFIKDEGEGRLDLYIFPITFFALFGISYLLKRSYMMKALRRFDENHLQEIYDDNEERFKKNYIRYHSFKKTNYPDYIAFFEGMVSTSALLILFGLNDPFFILGGMTLLLYEGFASLVLRRRMIRQENEIGEGENLIFSKNTNEEEKREAIKELNEKGYKYGGSVSAIRLIGVFVILLLSVIHLLCSQSISLNFYLFNFFGYLAISDGYRNVFLFFENNKQRQIDFLYFLEHFDDHPPSSLQIGYSAKK